jgi:hypothetical protein
MLPFAAGDEIAEQSSFDGSAFLSGTTSKTFASCRAEAAGR